MALTSFSQRMIGLFSTATLLFVFGLSAMATAEELIVEASESLEWKQDEVVYIATGNASAVQGNRSISGDILTARYNPDEDAQSICPQIGNNWRDVFDLSRAFSKREKPGMPGPQQVQGRITFWEGILNS